jgi:hypothetical protein
MTKKIMINKINELFDSDDISKKRQLQEEIIIESNKLNLQDKLVLDVCIRSHIDAFTDLGEKILTMRESAISAVS